MIKLKKKSLKVGKLVDTKHVDTVVRNYKKERWVQNSQRLGKEDSLSVWYSVEELEEYLQKVKSHGGDGIRMYFGVYSDDYEGQPLYQGRQTIVLVATKNKETEGSTIEKQIYVSTDQGSSILAYNAGKVCPPVCTTSDPGTEIGITIVDKGEEGMIIA